MGRRRTEVTVPDYVVSVRKRLKLNQQAFADLIGVSIVTVSRWETGVSVPHRVLLRRVKELAGYGNTRHGVLDSGSAGAERSGEAGTGAIPQHPIGTVPAGSASEAKSSRRSIGYDVNLPFEGQPAKRFKQNKQFPSRTIKAFEAYIRHSALPASDRLLLATMICQVAPSLNERFDRAAFLRGCHLSADIDATEYQPTNDDNHNKGAD